MAQNLGDSDKHIKYYKWQPQGDKLKEVLKDFFIFYKRITTTGTAQQKN